MEAAPLQGSRLFLWASDLKTMQDVKDHETRKKIAEAILDGKARIFFDENWKYPNDDTPGYEQFVNRVIGGSQKTIPLLHMLFNFERTGGFIIKVKTEDVK